MQDYMKSYASFFAKSSYLSLKGLFVRYIKNSREFYDTLSSLEESQWYSPDQFRLLQETKLRGLILHAYETVPYYNELFRKLDLRPRDIQSVNDLRKLPLLDKATVRSRPDDFISRDVSRRALFPGWTTGSTGTPINILRTRASIAFENAILWRQRRWAGVDVGCRKAAAWGTIWNNDVIVPASLVQPPFWRHNLSDRQLLLSDYHMSDETLPAYFRKLAKFKPDFIEGVPSSLLTLARHLAHQDWFFPLKAIFTSSEPLYAVHRNLIEQRFKTRVFDHYGQAERAAAAQECAAHTGLHLIPEYGICEILKNGRAAGEGESGEIVGTPFFNYGMPLIRYKTGDSACLAKEPCSCGRSMPLLKCIEGREVDDILSPDGRSIPGVTLMEAFYGITNIKLSEIVQEDLLNIRVRIVKDRPADDINLGKLRESLTRCLGSAFKINIETVNSIEAQERGKYRWVRSRVQKNV